MVYMSEVHPSWIDRQSLLLHLADLSLLEAKLDLIVNTLGEKHLSWFEHKGSNQCRICDLIVITSRLLSLIPSKSALDDMIVQEDFDEQYNSALESEPPLEVS